MQFISVESSPLRQDGQWWITYVKESWQELKTQSSPWPAGARRIKKLCAEEARKRTIFVLSLFDNSKASQWITIDIPDGPLTRVTISHDQCSSFQFREGKFSQRTALTIQSSIYLMILKELPTMKPCSRCTNHQRPSSPNEIHDSTMG